MYVAKHYEIPLDRLHNYLTEVRAGNLVTVHDDGPKATFVPFHQRGKFHLSRYNA